MTKGSIGRKRLQQVFLTKGLLQVCTDTRVGTSQLRSELVPSCVVEQ